MSMILAGQHVFSSGTDGDRRVGALTMSRLGSELALVYHDVVDQPLPASLKRLVDALDRSLAEHDRSADDEVTMVRRPSTVR